MNGWKLLGVVLRKELRDALRDRRTLLVVLVSSVLLGPLVLVALSGLIATLEAQAEKRELVASGIDQAPALRNFIERQGFSILPAPADYEARLRAQTLRDAVLVVPAGFEAAMLRGEQPVLQVVSDSGNKAAEAGASRAARLVEAFARERGMLGLALRGVSPQLLEPLQVEEHDLASAQGRAARLTGMLPFFVIMAVVYGALNAALDTTAGERERGSLEPLLANPAPRWALVGGKWGAVFGLAMLIAVLSCLSFLPAQWLLRSDTLQAMFQFGWAEALRFIALLLPLAAALSAVLMAVAIRCRSFKEAQANSTVVVLAASLLPLVTLFSQGGESPWHAWVPALAQYALMTRVLKGEALATGPVLASLAVCVLLTVAGIAFVAHRLRAAALR